jgi:hypothetical protein
MSVAASVATKYSFKKSTLGSGKSIILIVPIVDFMKLYFIATDAATDISQKG